jgi:glycosyltransferase involved in cell wall biosynthesis
MQPLVSISIPAYNNEATIGRTIESVLAQTYTNIELNIIDDNSGDRTLEVISGFDDPRIRIFHNEQNLGMTGNWNRCLAVATGEFVKLICADDLLMPEAVEKEVGAMIQNPSVNLVESDTCLVDIYGTKTGEFHRYHKKGIVNGKRLAKISLLVNNFFGAPVNNMIRKTALDDVGGFDSGFTYILDFEMWMRLACTGDVYIIHELLNKFTIRRDSNTGVLIGKDRKTYVDEHRRLVDKYREPLGMSTFLCGLSVFLRKLRNYVIAVYLKIFTK